MERGRIRMEIVPGREPVFHSHAAQALPDLEIWLPETGESQFDNENSRGR